MQDTFIRAQDIWALSITITGKCNVDCSYCHFYATRDRQTYHRDLDEQVFKGYVALIKHIKTNYHQNLQVRFSGGEPLMARQKLFDYADYLYQETGIRAFALSNGKSLDEQVIEKARQHHLSGFFVSIENPFDPDPKAPLQRVVIDNIKQLHSQEVAVQPAIMIVKNKDFKHLASIADYLYQELGTLPAFSELTYQAYQSPTDEELADLARNVEAICERYYGLAPLRFMPYVSPEFFANGEKNYLTELDLDNSLGVEVGNLEQLAARLYQRLGRSYLPNACQERSCPWFADCQQIKWLWQTPSDTVSAQDRLHDFCRFRKSLNPAIYRGVMQGAKRQAHEH